MFFMCLLVFIFELMASCNNVKAFTNIENFADDNALNQTRMSSVSGGEATMRPLTTNLSNPDLSCSLSSTEAIINSGGNPYLYTGFNDNQHYSELSGYTAWYKFTSNGSDEGGSYNLTPGGGVTHVGEHYDFEDSDGADYLTIADNDNLDFGTSDFTISAAVNIEASDSTAGFIIGKGLDGGETSSEWYIQDRSGGLQFVVNDGVNRTTGNGKIVQAGVSIGEWHILHLMRKNGYIYAYIDGNRVNRGYYAPNSVSNIHELSIGARSSAHDQAFDGQIDEVMIMKRALNYEEILAQVHALKTQGEAPAYDSDGGVVIDQTLPNDEVTFPATALGSSATVTFQAKRNNWGNEGSSLHDNVLDQSIIYAASSDGREIEIKMDYNSVGLYFRKLEPYEAGSYGKIYVPINPAINSFAANSWHTFTVTYDIAGFYMEVFIDGVSYSNLPKPETTENIDPNSTKDNYDTEDGFIEAWKNWQPERIWIGNRPSIGGSAPFGGTIRNLNIYNGVRYGNTEYPLHQAMIESEAIDSGEAGVQWNRLIWDETLPDKTDIEFQVSTSEDGVVWSPWIGQDKAIVTLSFDDGLKDQYGAWNASMRDRGLVGTLYAMYDSIGNANCGYRGADCMTENELDDLVAAGWEIGGHHLATLTSFSGSVLTDLISNIYNKFNNEYNWNTSTFAYPGGSYNPELISAVSEYFSAARSIEKDFPFMTFNRKFRLTTKAATTPTGWSTYLNKATAENSWLVMMVHGISGLPVPYNEPGSSPMTSTDFDTVMNNIKTRVDNGEIEVLTMQDALDRIMLTDNTGSSLSKIRPGRYVKWRAILSSYDGENTPTLDNVLISTDNVAPIIVITSPEEGDVVSGDDTIVFTNNEPTNPECSVDNSAWVNCTTAVANFSDLTNWDDIAESDTFNLYLRDTDGAGNTGTANVINLTKADTQAPVRSGGSPSGELPSNSTSATLSLTTNESATCKYSIASGTSYADMTTALETANGTTHTKNISGLDSGDAYNYHVRCQDVSENTNDTDYLISFSVASVESNDENTDDEKDLNIHSVKAQSSENTITITWETDHNTKSTIRYGRNKNLEEKNKDNDKEKRHKIVLNNLSPDTKYYFRIKATDSDDNEDSSRIHSIITKPVPVLATSSSSNKSVSMENSTENQSTPANSENVTPSTCSYTVQQGDTLWSIAKQVYGDPTLYKKITDLNQDLNTDTLKIGQELKLCGNNQTQENTQNNSDSQNSNQQTQNQLQSQTQTQPENKTFHWYNPFTWFLKLKFFWEKFQAESLGGGKS